LTTEVQKPYEWRKVIVWALTLFLLGLASARSPFGSGSDRFALGLLFGAVWAIVGGIGVAVWKYFKRSSSTISPAELQAHDKEHFVAALVLAVFLIGKSIYLETYGALADAATLIGLGFAIKAGFGPARWGFAIYAFVTPILVMVGGGGNVIMWPFVFYYVCRSLSSDVATTVDARYNSTPSFASPAPSINPTHTPIATSSKSRPQDSGYQPAARSQQPAMPTPSKPSPASGTPVPPGIADEDAIYAIVANELETSQTDKGLWTRLFAEMDGDEKKTKIAYIKQRAEKLIANAQSHSSQETQRLDEESKARAELMKRISTGAVDRVDAEKAVAGMGSAYLAACKSGKTSDVKRMVTDRPLLLAVRDTDGSTGLHLAVSSGHKGIVACLLEHGIYKQARTDDGVTASDMARQYGIKEIVALLD
jgi:hypothetical protein